MKGLVAAFAASCVVSTGCLGDNAPGEPPPASLVGTWRYLPKLSIGDVPVGERQVVVFGDDGHFEIRSKRGVESGAFTVDDRDLTIDADGGPRITTSFAATADRLLVDAMFPLDEVDGSVGVWCGTQRADEVSSTITLGLGEDGAGWLERTGPVADAHDGTWTYVGDDVVFTYLTPSGNPIDKHYQEIRGVAVGEWLYERVAP